MSKPTPLSRRSVLQTAGLLGVSAAAMSSQAWADEPSVGALSFAKESGLVTAGA